MLLSWAPSWPITFTSSCASPSLHPPSFLLTNYLTTKTHSHDSTNQTTFEHITPFYLLVHLPPLPPCRLSSPPQQHQLAFAQRRAVRAAHSRLRLYDVGWRRNTAQVFGTGLKRRRLATWAARVLWGGSSNGTGTQFPRNPHAEDVLVELAAELVRLENNADR